MLLVKAVPGQKGCVEDMGKLLKLGMSSAPGFCVGSGQYRKPTAPVPESHVEGSAISTTFAAFRCLQYAQPITMETHKTDH